MEQLRCAIRRRYCGAIRRRYCGAIRRRYCRLLRHAGGGAGVDGHRTARAGQPPQLRRRNRIAAIVPPHSHRRTWHRHNHRHREHGIRRRRAAARGAAARLEAHWRHERPARGGAATARPLGGAGAPRGAGGLDAAGPCLCVGPHGASRRQRQSGPAAGGVSQMSRARQLRRRGPLARAARRRAAAVRDRTHSDPARID